MSRERHLAAPAYLPPAPLPPPPLLPPPPQRLVRHHAALLGHRHLALRAQVRGAQRRGARAGGAGGQGVQRLLRRQHWGVVALMAAAAAAVCEAHSPSSPARPPFSLSVLLTRPRLRHTHGPLFSSRLGDLSLIQFAARSLCLSALCVAFPPLLFCVRPPKAVPHPWWSGGGAAPCCCPSPPSRLAPAAPLLLLCLGKQVGHSSSSSRSAGLAVFGVKVYQPFIVGR